MAIIAELLSTALQHQQAGRLTEAERGFRELVERDPTNLRVWYLLGTVEYQLRDWNEAARCFRQAVTLKPSFAEAHNNLGLALRATGQASEAESSFRRALQLSPKSAEA